MSNHRPGPHPRAVVYTETGGALSMKRILLRAARSVHAFNVRMDWGAATPRFSHWAYRLLPIALAGNALAPFTPKPHGVTDPWVYIETALLLVTLYASLCGLLHTGRLCERCIGGFPLNGPELAQARRKRLWVRHFRPGRRVLLPWGAWFATAIIPAPHVYSPVIRHSVGAALLAWFAFAWWWYFRNHERLAAWCPWCRHNRPPEDITEPDPDPSEGRPVPA